MVCVSAEVSAVSEDSVDPVVTTVDSFVTTDSDNVASVEFRVSTKSVVDIVSDEPVCMLSAQELSRNNLPATTFVLLPLVFSSRPRKPRYSTL